MKTKYLHIPIEEDIIKKSKIKSTLLGIDLKEFVSRVLDENTKNISLELNKATKIKK